MILAALVAALVLWPTSAQAEPVTLLAAAIAWLLPATSATLFTVGTTIVTISQVIAATILTGAMVGLQFLLTPGATQQQKIDPGAAKDTFTGEESPELRAVGRVRIGGVQIFGNTSGAQRYRLIGQCKGPIDGRENTYLGGQEVLFYPNGHVASFPYGNSLDGPPFSYIEVQTKDGDGTETAWTQLVTSFPTLWTTNHRVRGISQALVRYASPGLTSPDFLTLYANGPPQFEQIIRAEKIYDPRTEETTWTDNGILIALHVLLTWPEFTLDSFDLDFISAEADRADELVEVNGGGVSPVPTEPRSRAWGVWTSETPRGDVMVQLLQSIGAEIVPRPNDKLGIALIDDDRDAEITIPTRHIVELNWKSGPDSVERPNLCRLRYYSWERGYEMTEIMLHEFDVYGDHVGPSWARVQHEIDAVGEKAMDIDLPFCPSAAQAQRIARRLFTMARGDAGIATTNKVGLAAWGTRVIALEMPDDLGTHNAAIGPPRVLDDRGLVEIPFVILPVLSEWDPVVDSVPAPEVMPDFGQSDPISPPDTPSEITIVTNGNGTFTRLRAPGAISGVDYDFVEPSFRTFNAEGNPNHWQGDPDGMFNLTFPLPDSAEYIDMEIDLEGILTEFRIRVYTGAQRSSQWSGSILHTPTVNTAAPGDPTIEATDAGGGGATVLAIAPNDLHVAYMQFTGTGAPVGQQPCGPGDVFGWDGISTPGTWTAQAFATGGAASNEVSDSLP